MLPVVRRSWALKGQTPRLPHNCRHHSRVSAIGLLSVSPARRRFGCYHLLQPVDSINDEMVVAVLRQMRRHFRGPVIVVWDRLQAHRSAFVQEYLSGVPDLHIEYFPPYCPELNPVEYLWADSKTHDLADFCPHNLDELFAATDQALSAKAGDQQRLAGYLRKAELPLRLNL